MQDDKPETTTMKQFLMWMVSLPTRKHFHDEMLPMFREARDQGLIERVEVASDFGGLLKSYCLSEKGKAALNA